MKIDPRGQRFNAALSSAMLAAVLVTGNVWLLAVQTAVFGVSAVAGLGHSPYGAAYRLLIRPFLGPPAEVEDAAAPRFAQGVGLVFGAVALVGYSDGIPPLGIAATAAALTAAFLNAAFGLCLGCEMHARIRRVWPARQPIAQAEPDKEVTV